MFVGFGSIASGLLPLLLRHIKVASQRVTLITAPDRGAEATAAAKENKLGGAIITALTAQNYEEVLPKCPLASPALPRAPAA